MVQGAVTPYPVYYEPMTNPNRLYHSSIHSLNNELTVERFKIIRLKQQKRLVSAEETLSLNRIKALRNKIQWNIVKHGETLS